MNIYKYVYNILTNTQGKLLCIYSHLCKKVIYCIFSVMKMRFKHYSWISYVS